MAETVEVLERAVEAPEIVRALKPYGVTQSDIAAATGVSDRAVRGWRSSAIRPERYDRLSELRDIVLLLSETLTPRGVGQWLHARNRLLTGKRPVELLKAGKVEEVRRAAAAFADGSYV
jgi:transcriptional regulator with XRE-family HTH domain